MAKQIPEALKNTVVRELQMILKISGKLPTAIAQLYQGDPSLAIEVLQGESERTELRFKQLDELIRQLSISF